MHTLHTIPCLQQVNVGYQQQHLPLSVETNILKFDASESPKVERISKKGREHDVVEHWLGQHNRKFEILRTLTGLVSATTSSIVLLKIFGII